RLFVDAAEFRAHRAVEARALAGVALSVGEAGVAESSAALAGVDAAVRVVGIGVIALLAGVHDGVAAGPDAKAGLAGAVLAGERLDVGVAAGLAPAAAGDARQVMKQAARAENGEAAGVLADLGPGAGVAGRIVENAGLAAVNPQLVDG